MIGRNAKNNHVYPVAPIRGVQHVGLKALAFEKFNVWVT